MNKLYCIILLIFLTSCKGFWDSPKFSKGDCIAHDLPCESWEEWCYTNTCKVLEVGIKNYHLNCVAVHSKSQETHPVFSYTSLFIFEDHYDRKVECPEQLKENKCQ